MLHDTSRYFTILHDTSRSLHDTSRYTHDTSRYFTISDFTNKYITISDFTIRLHDIRLHDIRLHATSRLFTPISRLFMQLHAYSRLFTPIHVYFTQISQVSHNSHGHLRDCLFILLFILFILKFVYLLGRFAVSRSFTLFHDLFTVFSRPVWGHNCAQMF